MIHQLALVEETKEKKTEESTETPAAPATGETMDQETVCLINCCFNQINFRENLR